MAAELSVSRLAAVAAVIALVAAGAGCEGRVDGPPSNRSANGGLSTDKGSEGPQAALNEILEMELKVRELTDRLTEKCLRDKGITRYPQRSAPPPTDSTVAPRMSPKLEVANTQGYGVTTETPGRSPGDAAPPDFTFGSDEEQRQYVEALTGEAPGAPSKDDGQQGLGGCSGASRKVLFGANRAPKSAVIDVRATAEAEYARDAALNAKLKSWSECLQKADYPRLADPEDAARYAQYFHYPAGLKPGGAVPAGGPWPRDEALKREIALAVADATCADSHDLRGVQERAWRKSLNAALTQHEAEVFGYRDAMVAALKRGQQAL
ncbi:hypothetical protein [Micromonospora profundi]|uniref:hypothetical protein n=1 Tax=Micromonospora profundi TaxID=1420889 RepID=UPI0036573272